MKLLPGGGGDVTEESLGEIFMRPGNDVAGDEFADLAGGLTAGIHGGLHARDVTAADDRDESAADGYGFGDGDVGGLGHGVGGFDVAGVALGFNHADCFAHRLVDGSWLRVEREENSEIRRPKSERSPKPEIRNESGAQND